MKSELQQLTINISYTILFKEVLLKTLLCRDTNQSFLLKELHFYNNQVHNSMAS